MKIGVVSDTHIPSRAKNLPSIVMGSFADADYIIHAGDINTIEVIHTLEKLAPVTVVAGNTDTAELHSLYGEKRIVSILGHNFGVFHGHGTKGRTIDRAITCFEGDDVDCIIFGHSHIPLCEYHGSILMFNPGSPTDKRRCRNFSFGIIEINVAVEPHIIYF